MDVTVPAIPQSYDDYRAALRAFLADHKPTLQWKQRTGVRVPDLAERRGEVCVPTPGPSGTPAMYPIASGANGETRSNSASSNRSWREPACPSFSATRWWPERSSISALTSNGPPTCRRWGEGTTSGHSSSASPTPAAI